MEPIASVSYSMLHNDLRNWPT